jgi:hypothetical protein
MTLFARLAEIAAEAERRVFRRPQVTPGMQMITEIHLRTFLTTLDAEGWQVTPKDAP